MKLACLGVSQPRPNFNVVDSGVWQLQKDHVFEIPDVIIEIEGWGASLPKKLFGFIHLRAASFFCDRGWKGHLDPARFWETNSASPPVVETYLLLLMFASFLSRVM